MEESMADARRRTPNTQFKDTEPRTRKTEAPPKPASRPVTITVPSGAEIDVWREARRMRDEWRKNRYARLTA
jgi:hypothetical protein